MQTSPEFEILKANTHKKMILKIYFSAVLIFASMTKSNANGILSVACIGLLELMYCGAVTGRYYAEIACLAPILRTFSHFAASYTNVRV